MKLVSFPIEPGQTQDLYLKPKTFRTSPRPVAYVVFCQNMSSIWTVTSSKFYDLSSHKFRNFFGVAYDAYEFGRRCDFPKKIFGFASRRRAPDAV